MFDGHGGFAVSEWLKQNLAGLIVEEWPKADFCLEALSQACLRADYDLIQPPPGFFGAFGERGVGGAKCGSTAVIATLFEQGGKPTLATANVGDARILLVRDGKAVQLSVDHVPDDEAERKRIDRGNPSLRKSLVTFTEGSWRVGGVLALSRAFGDAFLKESGRFEGLGERNADYGSGFGLNAEPDCYIEQLTPTDSWVMLSSDGLFANDERGGGGGFENQEIADFLLAAPADASPESLAKELCSMPGEMAPPAKKQKRRRRPCDDTDDSGEDSDYDEAGNGRTDQDSEEEGSMLVGEAVAVPGVEGEEGLKQAPKRRQNHVQLRLNGRQGVGLQLRLSPCDGPHNMPLPGLKNRLAKGSRQARPHHLKSSELCIMMLIAG